MRNLKSLILFGLVLSISSMAQATQLSELIKALGENQPKKEGLYKVDSDFKFAAGAKASVIGLNSVGLGNMNSYDVSEDGVDFAIKTVLIKEAIPEDNVKPRAEIIFSVSEFEKRGQARGSEASHLRFYQADDGSIKIYAVKGNELIEVPGSVVVGEKEIVVKYTDLSRSDRPKTELVIARNATLDMKLSREIKSKQVKVADYYGGQMQSSAQAGGSSSGSRSSGGAR